MHQWSAVPLFVKDIMEITRLVQIFFSHCLVFFGGRYNGSGYNRQGSGEGGGQILMQYFCMCTVHQCSHTGVAVLHTPAHSRRTPWVFRTQWRHPEVKSQQLLLRADHSDLSWTRAESALMLTLWLGRGCWVGPVWSLNTCRCFSFWEIQYISW